MRRNWKKLPYWGTTVSIHKSMGEIEKELHKRGIETMRSTRRESPFTVLVEWEQEIRGVRAVVAFSITIEDSEIRGMTDKQRAAVKRQGVRLIFHTVKNLLAAVDGGLITLEEAFLPNVQTWRAGEPTTVGELVLAQIERSGELGPTIAGVIPERVGGDA